MSRYRDAPVRALSTLAAVVYLVLNLIAAVTALFLVRVFGWEFGVASGTDRLRWTRVLVAGFGAMALFRTSFFTVRVADQDVSVGPSAFLSVVLAATDRAVDRVRGKARSSEVSEIMKEVSFDKAVEALPAYCMALMQNLSAEEQHAFGKQIAALKASGMTTDAKALTLGLALLNLVGEDVLRAGVNALGDDIKKEQVSPRS